jgi:hypothetical protein
MVSFEIQSAYDRFCNSLSAHDVLVIVGTKVLSWSNSRGDVISGASDWAAGANLSGNTFRDASLEHRQEVHDSDQSG